MARAGSGHGDPNPAACVLRTFRSRVRRTAPWSTHLRSSGGAFRRAAFRTAASFFSGKLTIWERHWRGITAIIALFVLQSILIGKLLVERRSRRKATASLARLHDDLKKGLVEIQTLNGRLISAHEDERRRIAMELHDDLSQQVAVLGIRLSMIKRRLATVEGTRDAVVGVEKGLQNPENSIRALSHELHPALLERLGREVALQTHCGEFEELNGIRVHLDLQLNRHLDSQVALCLYRIVQEALRNVAKHSGSPEVWVSALESGDQIQLAVEDAGGGINPQDSGRSGIGLATMRERVHLIGGTFAFDVKPGRGMSTRVTVPLQHGFEAKA